MESTANLSLIDSLASVSHEQQQQLLQRLLQQRILFAGLFDDTKSKESPSFGQLIDDASSSQVLQSKCDNLPPVTTKKDDNSEDEASNFNKTLNNFSSEEEDGEDGEDGEEETCSEAERSESDQDSTKLPVQTQSKPKNRKRRFSANHHDVDEVSNRLQLISQLISGQNFKRPKLEYTSATDEKLQTSSNTNLNEALLQLFSMPSLSSTLSESGCSEQLVASLLKTEPSDHSNKTSPLPSSSASEQSAASPTRRKKSKNSKQRTSTDDDDEDDDDDGGEGLDLQLIQSLLKVVFRKCNLFSGFPGLSSYFELFTF